MPLPGTRPAWYPYWDQKSCLIFFGVSVSRRYATVCRFFDHLSTQWIIIFSPPELFSTLNCKKAIFTKKKHGSYMFKKEQYSTVQLWADPPRGRFSPSLLRPTSHPTLHPTPCLLSSKKPGHPTSTWRHLQGVREYSKVPCTSVLGTFVLFLLPAVWLLLWYSYSIFVIFSYSFFVIYSYILFI